MRIRSVGSATSGGNASPRRGKRLVSLRLLEAPIYGWAYSAPHSLVWKGLCASPSRLCDSGDRDRFTSSGFEDLFFMSSGGLGKSFTGRRAHHHAGVQKRMQAVGWRKASDRDGAWPYPPWRCPSIVTMYGSLGLHASSCRDFTARPSIGMGSGRLGGVASTP